MKFPRLNREAETQSTSKNEKIKLPDSLVLSHRSDNTLTGDGSTLTDEGSPNGRRDDALGSVEEKDTSLSGFKYYVVFVSTIAAIFLMALNASVVSTAIPQMTSHFHSIKDIGWYGSAYLLANCSFQPITGKIYNYYSTKGTFIIFIGIFELGSLLCGSANSSNMFIIGRAICGIGGSGIYNGSLTVLTATTKREKRPTMMGIGVSMTGIGMVIGPLVGGALTDYVSWRWCFYINLPCGGATMLLLSSLRIPDQIEKPPLSEAIRQSFENLDLTGFVLFAPACVMFLLALEWGGNEYAWDSATVIGLFCGSLVVICIFAYWQHRQDDKAMIPPKVLQIQAVFYGCLTALFQMGGLMMLTYYLPIWFQVVKDASPMKSGVMNIPTMVSQMIGAGLAGPLVSRIGYYTPFSLLGTVLSTVGAGLMSTFTMDSGAGAWIGYQVLVGLGRGMALQIPVIAAQTVLPAATVTIGTALIAFAQFFGGAIFICFGQTVFESRLRAEMKVYAPEIDAQDIIDLGATSVRSVIGAKAGAVVLKHVLEAYNKALDETFYLAVAGTGIAFVTSWGLGWRNIKKKTKVVEKDTV